MLISPGNRNLLTYSFIGIVTVVYTCLLFNLINRHSVNILFWDQWDFTDALFRNPGLWEMFSHQHGPHRQGLGAFVNLAVGWATNWNMRSEAFSIGIILVLATLAALYLKYRLFDKLTPWDALIPVIGLSFIQCEIGFPNTNPGYTALPLLFVILTGIILTLEKPTLRYSLLAVINFFAVFTGFSLFLGVIVPFILIFAVVVHWLDGGQRREMLFAAGAFAAALLTLGLFFNGYYFAPAVDCFQFPHPQPYEYLVFISNMLTMCQGFFYGYQVTFARRFGMILFGVWGLLLLWQAWQLVRTWKFSPLPLVNFLFFGFSIIYAVNTAVGRVCLGTDQGRGIRYMTLLIPGWLALYFSVLLLKSNVLRTGILAAFIILFVLTPLRQYQALDNQYAHFTAGRHKWVACYLEKEDIEECDRVSEIKIYPNAEATHLKDKLNLLKEKRYNLFSAPSPAGGGGGGRGED